MGLGAVLEPLAVVVLLFGGTWINRETEHSHRSLALPSSSSSNGSDEESGFDRKGESRPLSPSLLHQHEPRWRTRSVGVGPRSVEVRAPNTAVFRSRFWSRVLYRLPFVVECWYWALVYWVSPLRT